MQSNFLKSIEGPKVGTPEFEDAFNKMIGTWSRAFTVTLKTRAKKQKRLDELLTWDKPKNNDSDKWEHTAKVTALENLLKSDYRLTRKKSKP